MAEIKLVNPFGSIRGTYKNSALIYTEMNGRVIGRARSKNPRKLTTGQRSWMTFQTEARRAWRKTSPAQMNAWNEFGRILARYTDNRTGPRRGMDVFVSTNSYRLMMGLPIMLEAPTEPAPPPVAQIEVVPATQPDAYTFVVHHGIKVPDNHSVFVRVTAATPHAAMAPRKTSLRGVKGPSPNSFALLPPTGGTVTFTDSPISVEPGKRFAIQMRIIRTTDGLVSEPMTVDTFR